MANKQIQDFGLGTRVGTDLVLTQTAGGTTQQYPVSTLMEESYGELYEDAAGGGTAISTGVTYVGWVSATEGEIAGAGLMTSDVASATADSLIIGTRGGGKYWVTLDISFSGSGNETFDGCVHLNGSPTHIRFRRKLGTGGDVGAAAVTGILTLVSGDYIDVRVKSLLAAKTMTPDHVGLVAARVAF
jgi:hypothetical protein